MKYRSLQRLLYEQVGHSSDQTRHNVFFHKEAKIRVSPPPFSLVRFILAADERVGICTSDSVPDIL